MTDDVGRYLIRAVADSAFPFYTGPDFYVGPTGSDVERGGNGRSALKPYLTLQRACDDFANDYDLKGNVATIHVADGTYTAPLVIDKPPLSGAKIVIQGNTGTPGNVILSTSSASAITATNAQLSLSGVELRASGGFACLLAGDGGDISFSNVRFGTTTGGDHCQASGGKIHATGNYSIVGNAGSHWHSRLGGRIDVATGTTITLSGTPAFSNYFAGANFAQIYLASGGVTFSGSATGPRFLTHALGRIDSGGLGLTGFPGNAAGTFDSWGQYDTLLSGTAGLSAGAPLAADALFTGNANTVATVAPSFAAQIHAVGGDNVLAGVALDAFGSSGQNLITSRLSFGTAGSKSSVNAAAAITGLVAQAWDGSAYGFVASLDFFTANAQTGSDHGGFARIRTVPAGLTAATESMRWQASGGVTIGNGTTDPGIKNIGVGGAIASAVPVTLTGTSGSVGVSDSSVIVNASGTFTLTLPAAATYPGRWINLKSIAAQTVNSASSNVVPLAGGAAGTALLTATAGKWARLQSDGTNWILMSSN